MSENMFSLAAKTAVVTGGGRGLGAAMTRALLCAGADVVIIQRSAVSEDLERVAEQMGRRLDCYAADLGDVEGIGALAADILAERRIHILVNNAGTQARHAAADFPVSDFFRVLDVNLGAVFELCQRFGSAMLANGGGKIINVASLLSFQGGHRVSAYAASKGAVLQLTKALCNEWAPRGINVNALVPGYMRTDMNADLINDPVRYAELSGRIPAGRWGEPDDLAGAVVFLSSAASDYVHGVALPVDGGWLSR